MKRDVKFDRKMYYNVTNIAKYLSMYTKCYVKLKLNFWHINVLILYQFMFQYNTTIMTENRSNKLVI